VTLTAALAHLNNDNYTQLHIVVFVVVEGLVGQSSDTQGDLDAGGFFLIQPDPERAGEQSDTYTGGALVGLVVRGPLHADPGASDRDATLRGIQAEIKYLMGDGPVIATELGPTLEAGEVVELKTARLSNLNEVLTRVRNRWMHSDIPLNRVAVLYSPRPDAEFTKQSSVLPVSVLDSLIETTRTQLGLLLDLRATQAAPDREQVTVDTATGPFEYRLPLSLDDTYSSTEASQILSPTGKSHRTLAQNRRQANELLGVKVGNRYRYPKFQVDPIKHEIRPVVAHANRRLESDADPWGALDWWYSEDEGLGGRRPIDLLEQHELVQELIDFTIDRVQQGMD
jgi:hypothetical protein